MLFLYRIIIGYISVKFTGENTERILNLCAKNGYFLWDTYLIKNGIETNMRAQDFLKIRPILRGSKIRVHIIKKQGLPFKMAKYKLRLGLVCGFVLFIILLKILSSFIWVIEVDGNKKIKSENIIKSCGDLGVKEGILKDKIDTKILPQKLLLINDDISWASFNIEGSKLTVNVSEIKAKKDEEIPGNLISLKDAIIKKIDVAKGNAIVSVGDVVKKGEVLVSGITEAAGATSFVASKGKIFGEFTEEITLKEDKKKVVFYETGERVTKTGISVFAVKIPLFLKRENRTSNTEYDCKNLCFLGNKLPVIIYKKTYNITEKNTVFREYDELTALLEKRFLEKFEGKNYTLETKEITEDENAIYLKASVKICDEIMIESPILLGNE